MTQSGGGGGHSKARVYPIPPTHVSQQRQVASRSSQGNDASRPSSARSVQRTSPIELTFRLSRQVASQGDDASRPSSAPSVHLPPDVLQMIARQDSHPRKTAVKLALAFNDKQLSKMTLQSRHASMKNYAAKLNEKIIGGPPRTMNIVMRKTDISVSSDELRRLMNQPNEYWLETFSGHAPDQLMVLLLVNGKKRTLEIPDTRYNEEHYDKKPVKFGDFKDVPAFTEMVFANDTMPDGRRFPNSFIKVQNALQLMFPFQAHNNSHPLYVVQEINRVSLDTDYDMNGSKSKPGSNNRSGSENRSDHQTEISESQKLINKLYQNPSLGSVEGGARIKKKLHKKCVATRRVGAR